MTMQDAATTLHLFDARQALPNGLVYQPDVITDADETRLLEHIARLPLHEAQYKAYTARRRVANFGSSYDFTDNELGDAPPIPAFLLPLRERIAAWVAVPADDFGQALVTEYRPGTALGWHRDVPQFGVIVGVSLLNACRIRFRPYVRATPGEPVSRRRADIFDLELAPRSAYVLRDEVRWRWQHSIPTTTSLRYSITFRTYAGPSGRPQADGAALRHRREPR